MKTHPRIVVRVKKSRLYDEYVITNKHIICKFKYLLLCFDYQEQGDTPFGLVCLRANRLRELISEQNITFDTIQDNGYLSDTFKKLKEWHPSIDKVEVEGTTVHELDNLSEYPISWDNYCNYLAEFKYNNCISTVDDFEIFKNSKHTVVNVNVYFKLTKRIEKISEYGVNFSYLHKLLTNSLIASNNDKTLFLDEVTVKFDQLPFGSKMGLEQDEDDTHYVYPYIALLPLYP